MVRRSGVLVAAALLAASTAVAQTPAIPRIGFDDAVQRAIANNPTVAQAATAVTRAELLVRQARAATLPTAGASFANVTLESARGFSGGVTQPQNQSTIGADITVPLLTLARWAQLGQGRDQIEIAKLTAEDARRGLAIATAQAYLTIVVARRQLEVDARSVESARAHLDYATRRLAGGAGSRVNEVRAGQAVSSNELRLENSRLALRRAQEALGVLVAADGPLDAGAEPVFETPAASDEQQWLRGRVDVQIQQATQKAFERVVKDSWRDWFGTASASFDPQFVAPRGLFQPSNTWRLTVSFSQPIYEGGLRKAVLKLRELQVEQTRLALSGVELRARSELRMAQEAVQSTERALASARLAVTQAGDVLRITTTAFELGATTNIEVIDAQRSARDTESTAALAEDALRRARLDVLIAMGRFPK